MKRFLLSVFSTVDHKTLNETSFDESIEAIAVSPDGKYLFVAVGPSVKVLSAEDVRRHENEILTCANTVQQKVANCWPAAIAVSDKGGLYILKKNGAVQFSGLKGLSMP